MRTALLLLILALAACVLEPADPVVVYVMPPVEEPPPEIPVEPVWVPEVWHIYVFDIAGRTALSIPCMMLPDPDRGRAIYARRLRTLYYDVGFAYVEIDRQGEVYIRFRIMPLKVLVPKEYICLKAAEN